MEEEPHIEDDAGPRAPPAGEQLRAAREAKGMDIAQVAAETRIPQRHLEAIEAGDFHRLPSRTYAIGFTRTFARTVGLDEKAMIAKVREELAEENGEADAAPAKFEPGDPARVPSSKLAWLGALAAVLLLVGGYAFYSTYFAPGLGPAPLTADVENETEPASADRAAAINPDGEVVFTSEMDGTWVNFYEADGTSLYQAQMDEGDSFTLPSDATDPQIWTGRPYALRITIDGRVVPKISEEDEIVRDVPISARALLARNVPAGDAAQESAPEAGRDTTARSNTATAPRRPAATQSPAAARAAPAPTPSATSTPAATDAEQADEPAAEPTPAVTGSPAPAPAQTPAPQEAPPADDDGSD